MKGNSTICDIESLVLNEISFSSINSKDFIDVLKFIMSFMDGHCDYSPTGPKNVAMAQAVNKYVYFCVSAAS